MEAVMKALKKTVGVMVPISIAWLIFWMVNRHPYHKAYFTTEMKERFNSVTRVCEALWSSWAYDTDAHIDEKNAAYGFEITRRFENGDTDRARFGGVITVDFNENKNVAVCGMAPVGTDKEGEKMWFITTRGRWVYYPRTPWRGLLIKLRGEPQYK